MVSRITEILAEQKQKAQELTAMTLRVPSPVKAYVENLAEQLNKSRQDTLLLLLEEGIETSQKALETPSQEEKESRFFVLNTNLRHSDEDHVKMLSEGVALASFSPWKEQIERIKKGDVVFLYANAIGIVAFGTATGEITHADHKHFGDQEVYIQKLSNFTILEHPIPARDVRKALGYDHVFLKTLASLRNDKGQAENLLKMVKELPKDE